MKRESARMRQSGRSHKNHGSGPGRSEGAGAANEGVLLKECARLKAELETKAVEAAQDEEKSRSEVLRFINVLSHDLRSPLSVSSNFIALALAKYGLNMDPKMKEYLGYASDGLKTMERLLSDIVQYARIGLYQKPFVETDCNAVLESAMTAIRGEIESSGAQVMGEGSLPIVKGEVALITQLFRNLLSNALKYSNRPPRIEISAVAQEGQWLFSFRDNGIGIAPEDREKIFEPLERARKPVTGTGGGKGSGLGLAICKKIVEAHGGRIWVESTPGEGSTFYFTLPTL